jgi:hypothetical protein
MSKWFYKWTHTYKCQNDFINETHTYKCQNDFTNEHIHINVKMVLLMNTYI